MGIISSVFKVDSCDADALRRIYFRRGVLKAVRRNYCRRNCRTVGSRPSSQLRFTLHTGPSHHFYRPSSQVLVRRAGQLHRGLGCDRPHGRPVFRDWKNVNIRLLCDNGARHSDFYGASKRFRDCRHGYPDSGWASKTDAISDSDRGSVAVFGTLLRCWGYDLVPVT